jgi:hypothetical protein
LADYGIYGVTIVSEFPLALPADRGDGLVTISLRRAPGGTLREAVGGTPLTPRADWYAYALLADGSSYAWWRGVGEFLVSPNGLEILCSPSHGVEDESFQVYLLGQAFSFALVKAGFEPFHATAVERDGNALALVGESGQGKSTLAASFLADGARLLTDDLMLVSPGDPLRVYSGPSRIKLLSDAADLILGPGTTRVPMNREMEKYVIPVSSEDTCHEPARLRGLYILEHGEASRADIRIEPLAPREAFMALVAHTFNRYLSEPARLRRQLVEVSRIVQGVPVKRIVYTPVFERLEEVRGALLRDSRI